MSSKRFRNHLLALLISISLLGTLSLFYFIQPLLASVKRTPSLAWSGVDHSTTLEKIMASHEEKYEAADIDKITPSSKELLLSTKDKVENLYSIEYSSEITSDLVKGIKITTTKIVQDKVVNLSDILSLDQTDPKVISYIRQNHLIPPSKLRYANMSNVGDHTNEYSSHIKKLFNNLKVDNYNGTFIEAGAYDGEVASNSLALEENGWTGILIECNPILLPKLLAKNRKAWIANVCLSPTNTPKLMNFTTLSEWPASAKLGRPLNQEEMKKHGIDWVKNKTWINYKIPCFPLYSIIAATGEFGSQIDFLSLDVEGAEIDILKSFPHERFSFKAMLVEVHTFTPEEKTDLRDFIKSKGYELKSNFGNDDLYALKSV